MRVLIDYLPHQLTCSQTSVVFGPVGNGRRTGSCMLQLCLRAVCVASAHAPCFVRANTCQNFKQASFLWNFYPSGEILKLAECLSHRCN